MISHVLLFLVLQVFCPKSCSFLLQKALAAFELSNEADLVKQIGVLRSRIHRTKQKINAINAGEDTPVEVLKKLLRKKQVKL